MNERGKGKKRFKKDLSEKSNDFDLNQLNDSEFTVPSYQKLLSELKSSDFQIEELIGKKSKNTNGDSRKKLLKSDDESDNRIEEDEEEGEEADDTDDEDDEESDEESEDQDTQIDPLNTYSQEVLCKDNFESEDLLQKGILTY